ncbi:MAG: DNA polymerase IV [Eubacteriales bacterium]|nr:DNA polymerase IV [Eubacteriales bacterium]
MKDENDRIILHCDCNCFFASVEMTFDPRLKNVPMAVGGDETKRHGIILAKNELAKKFNIKTGETLWQARRKCPELIIVPPRHEVYSEFSKRVNEIYYRYTDAVEPFGIDESWLDVTHSAHLWGGGKAVADEIRRTVREEIGITVSVGVSFNKIFAKLGSDYKKPDATTVISRENYKKIVFPLPVGDLLYVGRASLRVLHDMGVSTIGDLAASDRHYLCEKLGKNGGQLYDFANGLDTSPVRDGGKKEPVKSVGNGMTFSRDLVGLDDILFGVTKLTDSVCSRMRRHGVKCRTVQVTLRAPDFRSFVRQQPLEKASNIAADIIPVAMELIKRNWILTNPIRMITVTATNLVPADEPEQSSLFESEDEPIEKKKRKLAKTMDELRGRFGQGSITFGRTVKNELEGDEETEDEK